MEQNGTLLGIQTRAFVTYEAEMRPDGKLGQAREW